MRDGWRVKGLCALAPAILLSGALLLGPAALALPPVLRDWPETTGGTYHTRAVQPGTADEVQIVVELVDAPVAVVYADALARAGGTGGARQAAAARLDRIRAAQDRLLQRLFRPPVEARLIYATQRVYNGVAVRIAARRVAAIRALPGVKAVHPLILKHVTNSSSIPYIGAPPVWDPSGLGLTGRGISVGIIDSGVDYLHTCFGGSGLASDYAANDTTQTGDGYFPSAKVVGGVDLVGDAYDASSTDPVHNTPMPDPDPMDCMGHGTHVAGTAAGFGMNADGTTYTGGYGPDIPFDALGIGPGVAPEADIYALRVFGCSGETAVVDLALEWAVDPDGDGDLADHLDVVNMSLATAYGGSDDPSSVAADNAALAGVIVVASAGNDRDSHFVTGSPASASRAISVAASADDGFSGMGVRVLSPASITGTHHAWAAGFGPVPPDSGTTALVALARPRDACSPLTNPDAEVDGRIVLVERGDCSAVTQVRNAQNAGANGPVGAVVFNNRPEGLFYMADDGSGGDITIPSLSIRQPAGEAMATAITAGEAVESTMTVVPLGDVFAWFSSRGPRRGADPAIAVKPDIAAPGVAITSARLGNSSSGGTGAWSLSGTSMASPHVAGVLALLRQAHPDWPVSDLKALAMNTASRLYLDPEGTPPLTSPAATGGGRVSPGRAVEAGVVAYDAQQPHSVSVSFGVLEVNETLFALRELEVSNHTSSTEEYAVSVMLASTVPGVGFSLPDGESLLVPPGGSARFRVELTAIADLMRHTHDPSLDEAQVDEPRHWMSEQSGWVVLAPTGGGETETLLVPVYAAARPASAMGASEPALDIGSGLTGVAELALSGEGVHTGSDLPYDVVSLVTALELQAVSPRDPEIEACSDLASVGVASDVAARPGGVADAQVFFGVAAHGDWSSPNEVLLEILIDRDHDGVEEYILHNGLTGGLPVNDSFKSVLWDRATGQDTVQGYLNSFSPDDLHTVPFSTNLMVLPVPAASLGLSPGESSFQYSARLSLRADAESGARRWVGVEDQSGWLAYEVEAAGLDLSGGSPGPPTYHDLDAAEIPVAFDLTAFAEHCSLGILLLHHHNGQGSRAEVVTLTGEHPDLSVAMTAAPDPVLIGETIRYDVAVSNVGSVAAADVRVRDELPDGVSFAPAQSDPSCEEHSGVVTCVLGELADGQGISVRIAVRVAGSVPGGTSLVNRVAAESGSIDPNPLNNTASATITAATVVPADLQVTKLTGTVAASPGDDITYTITVSDMGPGDATGTVIEDVFPQGLTDISWRCVASPGSTCTAGPLTGNIDDTADLIAGGSLTYTAKAVIRADFQGHLSNTASARAAAAVVDVEPANNSATTVIPVFPGLVFADGFESGDVTSWALGASGLATSGVSGLRSLRRLP